MIIIIKVILTFIFGLRGIGRVFCDIFYLAGLKKEPYEPVEPIVSVLIALIICVGAVHWTIAIPMLGMSFFEIMAMYKMANDQTVNQEK